MLGPAAAATTAFAPTRAVVRTFFGSFDASSSQYPWSAVDPTTFIPQHHAVPTASTTAVCPSPRTRKTTKVSG